ncbi:MAG: 16S rRNA (cytidine(1402)-2'-O)-methyltransferase [Geminocystis sp.]|nr:16S rRNA (cytidine(1402)-2'-O)-methyltransferase [Geminocystis sp.]MCX8077599.1 16S rRNA (cytidine(1402)-2'-O)-methyltransferase [Geminocystis sp.]HIK36542.1 16S rRNA (cytidine(1402)-2'-O)-methyltransferase [Geminocystis sp. M7585_C2015_104]
MSKNAVTGILYLVATPIGNLEDITLRAIRILKEVDLIAAEDTRQTAKLLRHYQISTPTVSYHEHNSKSRTPELLEKLKGGSNIALVTDAGTPTISDPGYDLVRECVASKIQIVPIPGAMAGITALIASGLPCDRFCFEGFLPLKRKERELRLVQLQGETRTIIFYEAPHRLVTTLMDLQKHFGIDRPLVVARELTKIHEEFWHGTIAEAIQLYQDKSPRGEYVLVVAGKTQEEKRSMTAAEIMAEMEKLREEGLSRKEAAQKIAQKANMSPREVYQLSIKEKS